jgi:hypothetical protein
MGHESRVHVNYFNRTISGNTKSGSHHGFGYQEMSWINIFNTNHPRFHHHTIHEYTSLLPTVDGYEPGCRVV